MLRSFVHTSHVSTGLIASLVMVYTAHQMRASNHLKTPVLSARPIDRDQTTRHVGKQTIIRVPITVVLVPLPRSTDERLLQHHLMMVMINLAAQNLFHWLDDTQAAHKSTVDIVFEHIR